MPLFRLPDTCAIRGLIVLNDTRRANFAGCLANEASVRSVWSEGKLQLHSQFTSLGTFP